MFAKKVHKETYKCPSHLLSKCFSNFLPELEVKPKFQIVTFFSDTTMAETALETLSLLIYLWFPRFEQKSTRIVKI